MTDDLGDWGESRAVSHLEEKGWAIESRNYTSSLGECDIIGWDEETLVFVEVKTRRDSRYGSPVESVTRDKREHIRRVASAFLAELDENVPCRFDVIGIKMSQPGEDVELRHIENAFGGIE